MIVYFSVKAELKKSVASKKEKRVLLESLVSQI